MRHPGHAQRGLEVVGEARLPGGLDQQLGRGVAACFDPPPGDLEHVGPAAVVVGLDGIGQLALDLTGPRQRCPLPHDLAVDGVSERRLEPAPVEPGLDQALALQPDEGVGPDQAGDHVDPERLTERDQLEHGDLVVVEPGEALADEILESL